MPTFQELMKRVVDAKHRKAIITKLVEYLDENFCPQGSEQPKMTLLDDDLVRVPVEMFEAVISDTLTPELEQLDAIIAQANATEMVEEKKDKKAAKEKA